MKTHFVQNTLVLAVAAILPATAQTIVSTGNINPIGIAANTNTVLFSQPYCDGDLGIQRGIYTLTNTKLVGLPASSSCAENYFAISSGLGGFAANQLYISGLMNGNPVIFKAPASGGAVSVFATLPVAGSVLPHAAITFDTVGTFNFSLIATGVNGIQGYDSTGQLTFFYPNPAPGTTLLEGATVAPLTYSICPGCLFIVTESRTGATTSGIYVVKPNTLSGTPPIFFATGPQEAEGIVFVPANPCTLNGYAYFVSGYNKPYLSGGGGEILGYTAGQLASYAGQFLVPNEIDGNIYAYSGGNAVGAAPNRTVFSSTGAQLEGATLVACPVTTSTTGFMTGGGQMNTFSASHGFNLGCTANSNHNNLEVNWAGGNHFSLTSISTVTCYMDPALPSPNPPSSDFNTMVLTGTGKYNGNSGATVSLLMTDAGEPGTNDQMMIVVTYNGNVVLSVPFSKLATGNQQAH